MGVVTKWTDEAILAEGRKYASRGEFQKQAQSAYVAGRNRGLLDQLHPQKNKGTLPRRTDAEILAEGRKYFNRSEFQKQAQSAYVAALRRGLLDQLYPDTNGRCKRMADAEILAEGRKYFNRSEFYKSAPGVHNEAKLRGLLEQTHPAADKNKSRITDEQLLAEAIKYPSRNEFNRLDHATYRMVHRRGLLDQIEWPEENATTDNDAIYIWRAVGQHYNGNPVYKIGVTSARLGTYRIETVAGRAGFEFDLICCEPVQCKATDLERKLHLLGEDPQFTGFDGCTEFRAMSDSALYAAVSIICGVTT